MKPGPQRTETWGLTPCPPQRACEVCGSLGPEEMHAVRELYVQGFPTWAIGRLFQVPNQALRAHAWLHNWYRRRALNLPNHKEMLARILLARARDAWHLMSPTTADRMLALLMKLGQASAEEEEVESSGTVTWEDRLRHLSGKGSGF